MSPKVLQVLSKTPLILSEEDVNHIKIFRKLLEWSMTRGLWSGGVGNA